MAPRFPIEICIAFVVALLVWPDTLFAGQLTTVTAEGKIPATAMTVPAYAADGRLSVMRIMNPTMASEVLAMMKGALSFVLSASTATIMVKMNAAT